MRMCMSIFSHHGLFYGLHLLAKWFWFDFVSKNAMKWIEKKEWKKKKLSEKLEHENINKKKN